MINYTYFGRIIDIKAFTEEFGEDHKIVITFSLNGLVYPEKLADASYTLNRIRSYPDNYVVCDIGEILRAKQKEAADRVEILNLKKELEALKAENEKLKELNKSIGDRGNRLVEECTIYKERIDELEVKCGRLEQDNGIKADAVVAAKDRGDYWKDRHYKLDKEFNLLKQGHDRLQCIRQELEEDLAKKTEEFYFLKQKYDVIFDAGNLHRDECIKLRDKVEQLRDRWDAMYTSLKEKGVKVLYLGDVDGQPVIDVKFADEWLLNNNIMKLIIDEKNQRISELEERINELESDRTARVTINPNGSLTFSRDGKSETVLMPLEEEDPTKCVYHKGVATCMACSTNTPSFLCANNPHPCKLYEKKED